MKPDNNEIWIVYDASTNAKIRPFFNYGDARKFIEKLFMQTTIRRAFFTFSEKEDPAFYDKDEDHVLSTIGCHTIKADEHDEVKVTADWNINARVKSLEDKEEETRGEQTVINNELEARIVILETCNSGSDLMHNGYEKRFAEIEKKMADADLFAQRIFNSIFDLRDDTISKIGILEENIINGGYGVSALADRVAKCENLFELRLPLNLEERIKKLDERMDIFCESLDEHDEHIEGNKEDSRWYTSEYDKLEERIKKLEEAFNSIAKMLYNKS